MRRASTNKKAILRREMGVEERSIRSKAAELVWKGRLQEQKQQGRMEWEGTREEALNKVQIQTLSEYTHTHTQHNGKKKEEILCHRQTDNGLKAQRQGTS